MLLVCALKTSKLAAHLLCNLSQYWLTECLDFALSPIMQSSAANPSVPRSATKVSCLSCSQVSKRSRPPSAATPDAEKGVQGRAAHEAARQTSLPPVSELGSSGGQRCSAQPRRAQGEASWPYAYRSACCVWRVCESLAA